eukprot:11817621-Alexandrium_andersonii.AAC.1
MRDVNKPCEDVGSESYEAEESIPEAGDELKGRSNAQSDSIAHFNECQHEAEGEPNVQSKDD